MCRIRVRPLGVHPAPGATAQQNRPHAGGARRQHVVVQPVADISNEFRGFTGGLDDTLEEDRIGFATPQPAEVAITSAGTPGAASAASASIGWLPAISTLKPRDFSAARHGMASG